MVVPVSEEERRDFLRALYGLSLSPAARAALKRLLEGPEAEEEGGREVPPPWWLELEERQRRLSRVFRALREREVPQETLERLEGLLSALEEEALLAARNLGVRIRKPWGQKGGSLSSPSSDSSSSLS